MMALGATTRASTRALDMVEKASSISSALLTPCTESDTPRATLRVAFQAQRDYVDYALTLQIDDDQLRQRMATHLCFNHCWADGFGRDALVRIDEKIHHLGSIPNPKRIWIRVATAKEDPLNIIQNPNKPTAKIINRFIFTPVSNSNP